LQRLNLNFNLVFFVYRREHIVSDFRHRDVSKLDIAIFGFPHLVALGLLWQFILLMQLLEGLLWGARRRNDLEQCKMISKLIMLHTLL